MGEICGANHRFIPIVIEIININFFSIRSNTQIEFDSHIIPSNELDVIKFRLLDVDNKRNYTKALSDLTDRTGSVLTKVESLSRKEENKDLFFFTAQLHRFTY